MVTTLRVRISLRPWALPVLRWPISISPQGSAASCRRTVGWLPFTVSAQCAPVVEVFDMIALGVQSVRGDHSTGQVAGRVQAGQGVQQWDELGDLAGLAVHIALTQQGAGVVVDDREQVPGALSGAVGGGGA